MKKLTLTTKLMLLLALPLTGVIIFGLIGAWNKWAIAQNYKRLQYSAEVLNQVGNVIHQLQRERGRSALFVSSKGTQFAAELPVQQQATDETLQKLQALLAHFDAATMGKDFESDFQGALAGVSQLSTKRTAIHDLSITSGDSTAYFTATIKSLLKVAATLSHHVDDVEISTGIQCYVSFLQAKEQTGMERAVLAGVFGADKFSGDAFNRFSKAVAAQETYMNVFESLASTEQKKICAETVQGPVVDAVAKMQQTAVDKASSGGFDVNPAVWYDAITSKIDLMKKVEDRLASDYNTNAQRIGSRARQSFITYVSFTLALVLATALFGLLTIRSIMGPLRTIITALTSGAYQTSAAASQISSASQMLANGASEQAASLEETSASLEEMSSMTRHNSENTCKANELAKQARHSADKGAQDMHSMSAAMDAIKVSNDDIAKIIKTIDEIAFQTNILALNAAVEAARAGEAGMGFAVVADEVRNLAQRSAQAAKETAAKIEGAIVKGGQGVEISTKVAETLNNIVAKVREVDELVNEVSSASKEQNQGITQINTAVNEMDKVTQSNAASAEESASAAEELNAQAEAMKISVIDLINLVGGNIPGATVTAPIQAALPGKVAKHPIRKNGRAHAAPVLAVAGNGCADEIPMEGDFKDF